MTILGFAYGSNLDDADRRAWCARTGMPDFVQQFRGPAWLPDHDVDFRYRSAARGGGALRVNPQRGHATPGMLFDIGHPEALRAKEGYPTSYREAVQPVYSDAAGWVDAIVYHVVDARVEAAPVTPGPGYAEAVIRGLQHHGLPVEAVAAAARGQRAPLLVSHVFVYGTLRAGQARAPLLMGARRVGVASVAGALVNLGSYPGLVAPSQANPRALGEVYVPADLPATLAVLDRVEGFAGYAAAADNLYVRTPMQVRMEEGQTVRAWTYLYARDPGNAPSVPGGDWLALGR